ncbi:MAG: hypothetical protein ACYS22_05440 [Planctomycetota bacterium]|jgi:hypothetical protein
MLNQNVGVEVGPSKVRLRKFLGKALGWGVREGKFNDNSKYTYSRIALALHRLASGKTFSTDRYMVIPHPAYQQTPSNVKFSSLQLKLRGAWIEALEHSSEPEEQYAHFCNVVRRLYERLQVNMAEIEGLRTSCGGRGPARVWQAFNDAKVLPLLNQSGSFLELMATDPGVRGAAELARIRSKADAGL